MELHELTALELGEQLRAGAVTQDEAIAASAARTEIACGEHAQRKNDC